MIESPILIILLKAGLLAVVVGLAAKNLLETWRDLQSDKWPTVRAKALTSRVMEAPIGQRRGFMGSHVWQVRWEYRVDGKQYTSKLTEPFPPTTEANATLMASKIEKDDTFDVRYNPQNSADSRLAINSTTALVQFLLRLFVYTLLIGVSIWAVLTL